MASFTDKLKLLFTITPSTEGPRSPDPLTHLPPSTQVLPKKLSDSAVLTNKVMIDKRIPHSISSNEFRSDLSPYDSPHSLKLGGTPTEGYEYPTNISMIQSLLNSFQISLRVLVMQQPKTCAHKPPVILFDTREMTSSCVECHRVFYPEQMSELIFGNCYISTPSGLKLQTLHYDCIMLSRVICHNAPHLVKSNQSSTQILSTKLSTSLNPYGDFNGGNICKTSSLGGRCKTATYRSNIERDLHKSNKPLSSSFDSKFTLRPDSLFSSPVNSHCNLDLASGISAVSSDNEIKLSSVDSLTSPQKLASKTRRLAIVLIFHEKDGSSTRIEDIFNSNFLSLENSLNKLIDNLYDVIESTTAVSFRPSLAVAIEEFLSDLSSNLPALHPQSVHERSFSILPLQLYTFNDCPVKQIPLIISNLHTELNCVSHTENFFSRLLTAFFTYHHSWLVSILQHAKKSDKFQTLSSYLEMFASRYGYSPSSPFLCKILLVDKSKTFNQELLSQIVILFSYFFRFQVENVFSNKGANLSRDRTPSNEDFLIISMENDSFDLSSCVRPEVNTNNSNIQYYTYKPPDENNIVNSNSNYEQVPFTDDTIFAEIFEDNQIANNWSILNYALTEKSQAILRSFSELKHIFSHLEADNGQDELFSLEDNLYELGNMSSAIPPPTLIIADLDEFTVEVIHDDSILDISKSKESVLPKAHEQKQSKLIHMLIGTISRILEPLPIGGDEDAMRDAEVNNCEIALVYLESALEDLYMKANLVVKHLKSWLEWGQGIEDHARTHDLFSELICLLRVDATDLEMLLTMAYVISPEERDALGRLISFLSAY